MWHGSTLGGSFDVFNLHYACALPHNESYACDYVFALIIWLTRLCGFGLNNGLFSKTLITSFWITEVHVEQYEQKNN